MGSRESSGFSRREFLQKGLYLAASTALLVSCGPITSPGKSSGKEELKPLKFAAISGGQGALLLAIVRDEKLDEKHGVRIVQNEMPLRNIQPALLSGGVDSGYFNPLPLAVLVQEGYDVISYGPWAYNHSAWVVRKDSPYQSLADLKGKKIGTTAKSTSVYTQSQTVAAELGLNWEKEFQVITGEITPLVAFLTKKEIEMATLYEPFTSRLLATGQYRVIAYVSDEWKRLHGVPMMSSILGGRRQWFEQNRDLARKLADVFVSANAIAAKPETYDRYRELLKIETDAELQLVKQHFPRFMGATWNDEVIKDLDYQVKRSVELKLLEKAPDTKLFVMP